MRSRLAQLFFGIALLIPFQTFAESTEDLASQVERLEKTVEKLSSQELTSQDRVRTFFSESLALGGYFENGMVSQWGPNTPAQTLADSQRLGISLTADLSSRVQIA